MRRLSQLFQSNKFDQAGGVDQPSLSSSPATSPSNNSGTVPFFRTRTLSLPVSNLMVRRTRSSDTGSSFMSFRGGGGGFRRFGSEDIEEKEEEEDLNKEETLFRKRLIRVLGDIALRKVLIQDILSLPGDYIERIRFCSCVLELSQCESEIEKEQKGSKIVGYFVEPNAMFRCKAIDPYLLDKLLTGRLEYLEPLKNVFIRQLCSVEQIVTSVNKMALFWEETAE